MTIGRVNKSAVGGYGATAQPKPAGHEAKAPKGEELAEQPAPGGAKYNADTFEGSKHSCKGGHAAEDKKAGGHEKDKAGEVTPPAGGTPPEQGAYPATPPAGGTPPAQGTPPAGDAAEGTPQQGIQKAVEEITNIVQQLIEALGGQPPEQQAPGAPAGNTGIVPPGAVQGTPPTQALYAI
jgi:hypothetical protein